MRSIRRIGARGVVALVSAAMLSGCMFNMNHRLPPDTLFGGGTPEGVRVTPVERSGMKNYLLAGLLPWTSFGAKDLVAEPHEGQRLADVELRTEFNWLDTVVWVVPGFFYGYYVWAPRHVEVRGAYVDEGLDVVPAEPASGG